MNYTVMVLPEATEDLIDLHSYIANHDSLTRANTLLDILEEKCLCLGRDPQRGHIVPELAQVYIEGFREIHYKPWRIIFQISGDRVYIHAVLDGRRELREVLERRMLR